MYSCSMAQRPLVSSLMVACAQCSYTRSVHNEPVGGDREREQGAPLHTAAVASSLGSRTRMMRSLKPLRSLKAHSPGPAVGNGVQASSPFGVCVVSYPGVMVWVWEERMGQQGCLLDLISSVICKRVGAVVPSHLLLAEGAPDGDAKARVGRDGEGHVHGGALVGLLLAWILGWAS